MDQITVEVMIDTPKGNSLCEPRSPTEAFSLVGFKKRRRRKIIVTGILAASILPPLIVLIGIALGLFFRALGMILVFALMWAVGALYGGLARVRQGLRYDCSEPRAGLEPAEIVGIFMKNFGWCCGPSYSSDEQLLPVLEYTLPCFIQRYFVEPKALIKEWKNKWGPIRHLLQHTIAKLYGADDQHARYTPCYDQWGIKEEKRQDKDVYASVQVRIHACRKDMKKAIPDAHEEVVPDKVELTVLYNIHMVSYNNSWMLAGFFPIDCKVIEKGSRAGQTPIL